MKETGFEDYLIQGSVALLLQDIPLPWTPNDVDIIALRYGKTSFSKLAEILLEDGHATDIGPYTKPPCIDMFGKLLFKIDGLKYDLMDKIWGEGSDFSLRTTVKLNDLTF